MATVKHPESELAVMQEVARSVAGAYKRKYSTIEYNELYQEAWLHVLHARSMYVEWMGGGYLRNAAMRAVSRSIWQGRKPCVTRNIEAMRKMTTVALEDVQIHRGLDTEGLYMLAEAKGQVVKLRTQLRARLAVLHRDEDDEAEWRNPALAAALYVLVDGQQPKDVAARVGIPLPKLYRETESLKTAAKTDRRVRRILHQLIEHRSVISDAQ
jgi:hypothetical protein